MCNKVVIATDNFDSIRAKTKITYSKSRKCRFSKNAGAKFVFIS